MVTWPMTPRDPKRSNSLPQYVLQCNISETAGRAKYI